MNLSPHVQRAVALLVLATVLPAAFAATVNSVSPLGGRLDAAVTFTVQGTGLANVSVQHCTAKAVSYRPDGTSATLQCVPTLPGVKNVLVDGVASGRTVVFDHPTRQGNPAARGIPAVGGVSLFNGNFFHQATDMAVPGKGPAFTLSRSYNSYSWTEETRRGGVNQCQPWRFNWDLRVGWVPKTDSTQLFVEQADGSGATFYRHTDGLWYPMDQGNFDQVKVTSKRVEVRTRAGMLYSFKLPDVNGGRLESVSDAHSQGLTLSYGANGKVASVLDSNNQRYFFSYDELKRLVRVENRIPVASANPTPTPGPLVPPPGGLLVVDYGWVARDPADPACSDSRDRLSWVKDIRGQVTNFSYSPALTRSLARITDPSNRPVVQLTYDASVYGNVGVKTLKNGVNDTWQFAFCADSAASLNDAAVCGGTELAKQFRTTVTPPLGPNRQAFFDFAGRAAGGIDGESRRSGSTAVPTAGLTETNYNRAGLPKEVRSPLAMARTVPSAMFEHDTFGRMTKVLDARNKPQTTAWTNPNGTEAGNPDRNLLCPTRRTSAEGLVSTTARDATCRVTEQARPGSPAGKLTYNDAGGFPTRVSAVLDPRQNSTTLSYDSLGNLAGANGPEGETTSTTYDRLGRRKTETNALLGITYYEYLGGSNLVTRMIDPIGAVTLNTYDASGNLKTRTAPNNQVTTYTYDNANRLFETTTTVATANGPQVVKNKTVYDALGRVAQTINANNNASTTTFDNAGNALARANALSQATRYVYDDDNRVTKVTDASGRVTTTVYDDAGRITSVSTTAGTQSYEYDDDGRVVRSVDARGNATLYRYDPNTGHLIEVTDARLQITSAEYDAAGNVVAITDPNRNTTRFVFDKSNRRTQRTDPNGHIWRWEYDKAGNVRFARAPGGLVTEYTYDRASRLMSTSLPDGQLITYAYDTSGNRTSMTDATGITRYAYDGLNRLTQVTDPRNKVLKYGYDAASNRTAITYPHNKVVGYGFDAAERMVSVTDWLSKTHRYTLNAAGQVTELALANGTKATMAYDAAGRLLNLANTGPGNTVISSHALTMDPNGNITEAAVQLPLLPSFGASTKTMTYDVANRLKTVDGAPVVHDDAGRLTSIGGEGYAYDARDLLTTITGPNAGTNTYNGAGHRVAHTAGGATTRYVIDPSPGDMFSVLAETDNSGNLLRSYIHGYGLLMQVSSADVPRYYHFDPTGHTVALTDAVGVVTDKYAHTPYGETTTSGSTVNPFRFVGKFGVADEGNGLHYMRARHYRSEAHQFLSRDAVEGTLAESQSLNLFGYVRGQVVRQIDPSGLAPVGSIADAILFQFSDRLIPSVVDALQKSDGERIKSGTYAGSAYQTNGCGGQALYLLPVNLYLASVTNADIACDIHDMNYSAGAGVSREDADMLLIEIGDFVRELRMTHAIDAKGKISFLGYLKFKNEYQTFGKAYGQVLAKTGVGKYFYEGTTSGTARSERTMVEEAKDQSRRWTNWMKVDPTAAISEITNRMR